MTDQELLRLRSAAVQRLSDQLTQVRELAVKAKSWDGAVAPDAILAITDRITTP